MTVPRFGVVILNRYPDIASRFLESIRRTHTTLPEIVVVCDRHITRFDGDVMHKHMDGPFIFARNANAGISAFEGDVILCNDDLTCVDQDFFSRLDSIANKYPKCGIMSPLIDGGVGNPAQSAGLHAHYWPETPGYEVVFHGPAPICFPCVHIKRSLVGAIGYLDEGFTGYGLDDDDYCLRARHEGFWTMITRQLTIKHGGGGAVLRRGVNWSASFAREAELKSNQEYFTKKHSPQKSA